MYKLIKNGVLHTELKLSIHNDPTNADYAQYLSWLAMDNTPDTADPIIPIVPAVISMAQARLALLDAVLDTLFISGGKLLFPYYFFSFR